MTPTAAPPIPTTTPTPAQRLESMIGNLETAPEDSRGLCSVNRLGLLELLREVLAGVGDNLEVRVYKYEAITTWRRLEELLNALEHVDPDGDPAGFDPVLELVEKIRAEPMRELGRSAAHAELREKVEAALADLAIHAPEQAIEKLRAGLAVG